MSAKQILKRNKITANVLTDWGNSRCKFWPGESAKPTGKGQRIEGTVIAVSTVDGVNIRSANRGHTRYFVAFADGGCRGYFSHQLRAV